MRDRFRHAIWIGSIHTGNNSASTLVRRAAGQIGAALPIAGDEVPNERPVRCKPASRFQAAGLDAGDLRYQRTDRAGVAFPRQRPTHDSPRRVRDRKSAWTGCNPGTVMAARLAGFGRPRWIWPNG